MSAGREQLTDRQRALLDAWLPGASVSRDLSWGLVGTRVLELSHDGTRYIAKAGDERDHHLARELHAHRHWLGPLTSIERAPRLVRADQAAKLLLTRYLPGTLVQGDAAERDPDVYHQAGELLTRLHAQLAVEDADFERRANATALAWLAGPHGIEPDRTARLRALIASWPTPSAVLVATHGDWQPRNWLIHRHTVSVIDFGRAALRPAMTDLARLAVQQFRTDPALETAFLAGYGHDPRESSAWQRIAVREAIGTAAWAHQVGDEKFEQQGHRMLDEALESF